MLPGKNSVKLWFTFSISLINYSLQLKVVMFSIKTKNSLDMRKDTFYFLCSNPTNSCQNGLEIKWIQKVMIRNMTRMWGGVEMLCSREENKCVKPQFTDQMCRSSPSAQTLCFKFTQEDKRTRQEWRWPRIDWPVCFRPRLDQTKCRQGVGRTFTAALGDNYAKRLTGGGPKRWTWTHMHVRHGSWRRL